MNEPTIENTDRRAGPKRWLNWLTGLALGAGLAMGLFALAAAVGVWMGFWEFGQGFDMLRIANSYAAWVAAACLLIAIAVFAASRHYHIESGMKLTSIALIGTVAAALAYFVPESYRPAPNTPAIHDISTDTTDPPQFVDVLPLRVNAPNTAVYGGDPGMPAEELSRLQREAYPDVDTVQLDVGPEEAFERAMAAVDELGWELVAAEPEEGRIEATDTTFWFRFKDDVVIRIRPQEDGSGSIVDARSVSRVGRSDVGKNAARLREFFEVL